jgi:hypothetical protein
VWDVYCDDGTLTTISIWWASWDGRTVRTIDVFGSPNSQTDLAIEEAASLDATVPDVGARDAWVSDRIAHAGVNTTSKRVFGRDLYSYTYFVVGGDPGIGLTIDSTLDPPTGARQQ